MKCDRCFKDVTVHSMSYFNTDTICMECKAKERAHPDFQKAIDRENEEVKKGNFGYPGIGKPNDL